MTIGSQPFNPVRTDELPPAQPNSSSSSQPAVTQQIHALERDYGRRLFTYDGSRLYRTPEAEKLAQYARVAVYNDQRMRQELAAPKILSIRLGATKTIGEFIIGEDLCSFLKRPDRTLRSS